MDQVKIGKFIAECRKNKKLTQAQLAEKLNITDKAISKWETGKGMPDSSIRLELCDLLGISVNELLSGEVISMENYKIKAEENLMELQERKLKAEKAMWSRVSPESDQHIQVPEAGVPPTLLRKGGKAWVPRVQGASEAVQEKV